MYILLVVGLVALLQIMVFIIKKFDEKKPNCDIC